MTTINRDTTTPPKLSKELQTLLDEYRALREEMEGIPNNPVTVGGDQMREHIDTYCFIAALDKPVNNGIPILKVTAAVMQLQP